MEQTTTELAVALIRQDYPVLGLESEHKEAIEKKFEYFKNWAKGQVKGEE